MHTKSVVVVVVVVAAALGNRRRGEFYNLWNVIQATVKTTHSDPRRKIKKLTLLNRCTEREREREREREVLSSFAIETVTILK